MSLPMSLPMFLDNAAEQSKFDVQFLYFSRKTFTLVPNTAISFQEKSTCTVYMYVYEQCNTIPQLALESGQLVIFEENDTLSPPVLCQTSSNHELVIHDQDRSI